MQWLVGCSGFSYKHWKGCFYPEKLVQRKWFGFYNERFNVLELNVTFYRFPRLSFVQNWFATSPDDYLFAVKAPRLISHYKKFLDCERFLSDFYGTISEGLQHKLGPVLFQLSPKTSYSDTLLQRIVESVDKRYTNVVEFRHPSWWHQGVYDELAKNNITFCGISHPGLPDEVVTNTNTAYYRFHGVPHLYSSQYSRDFIETKASEIAAGTNVEKAYIFFNNDINMSAIYNAFELKEFLKLPSIGL